LKRKQSALPENYTWEVKRFSISEKWAVLLAICKGQQLLPSSQSTGNPIADFSGNGTP
jgi:hypothetical protein